MGKRVLMIGLDGATFTLLRPLSEQGVIPYLTSIIRQGTSAHLMSTRNPLTPPAWTTMTTGVSPERHGIYDFLRPAYLEDGSVYLKVNDGRQNRAETIFAMVNRYNQRGTAEQWIQEGKNAVNWTELSCRWFKDNAARLQLFALAYNLGNFLRQVVLPKPVRHWSLTTLREKLIKIGAEAVTHAKYVVFQLAAVAVPRTLFAAILTRIGRLRRACDSG